jgi:hypothetical protein
MEKDNLDVVNLVRSIQRAEGHTDCFRRSPEGCDQPGCAWRPYCLENFQSLYEEGQQMDNVGDG